MWKPVSKKPKKDGKYLVVYTTTTRHKEIAIGYWGGMWSNNVYSTMKISHWRGLPRLPR